MTVRRNLVFLGVWVAATAVMAMVVWAVPFLWPAPGEEPYLGLLYFCAWWPVGMVLALCWPDPGAAR